MKRLLALCLCAALLCPAAAAAEGDQWWSRSEPNGHYVTVRLPCPEGEALDWSGQRWLGVRYADTGEPVPLTSDYQWEGFLFATLPAEEAGRALEVFVGEEHHFPDCTTLWNGRPYYNDPGGAGELYLRGVVEGDQAGNLNPESPLSRAEAFALVCRLLSLEPAGSPGYADVSPGDWYYDTASAARAAGIAAADTRFHPDRTVTRGEFTVLLARAMEYVGWLAIPEGGTAADLSLADAGEVPDWALGAYLAFGTQNLGIFTQRPTGETDPVYGEPEVEFLAEWDAPALRGEAVTFLDNARTLLPWYPTQAAIDWGFDQAMPSIDGSTSTYPYTRAVYGALFTHAENHPQFPAGHSKSHESYERLIRGEVDFLFAATLPSEELKAQAEAAGVELECVPIAHDAMVFFTNGENTMEGLTQKQIQDIYVYGKYTNWNQLGGPDAELLPYRRNTDSGSHALMEQYFLEGGKLSLSPDVHNVLTSYAMSSALTDVAQALRTDPPAYAIGYSVYYYYVSGYWLLGDAGGGELKLLAVDGVLPSDQTIADGSYPLAGYNYAVFRAGEPEDSPARRLAAFMVSEAGQACVGNAGFGPLSSDPAADFEAANPGWTAEAVVPVPQTGGYFLLARSGESGALRGVSLNRAGGVWGDFLRAERPAPAAEGLTAAALGEQGCTLVFGAVGDGLSGALEVRLLYGDGRSERQPVSPGQSFHFLLEGRPELAGVELLRDGRVLDRCTELW